MWLLIFLHVSYDMKKLCIQDPYIHCIIYLNGFFYRTDYPQLIFPQCVEYANCILLMAYEVKRQLLGKLKVKYFYALLPVFFKIRV